MIQYDAIYLKIRDAIVAQQLEPGVRLPEDKLAERFNVSRTAIRKVLQRLAIENFITIQPNKGAEVRTPTATEAQEVFDSRVLIETNLLPTIIANWQPSDAKNLSTIIALEDKAKAENDFAATIKYTALFHIELAKIANNHTLSQFVEQLAFRSSLTIAVFGTKHSVGCDCGSHAELVSLLDNGEEESAMKWMTHHLKVIQNSLVSDSDNKAVDFNSLFH
ncbi:GntR family transcriptional regulator [Photobacterium sp. ZSDE20]|uniref:GntR family transcriptional regulator n=1 Tax=Photobacterium pectinilyticum TaxID=2906793 RepID=A0ABT1N886_9GAMM|nr:GntR family transcriptional regulator [Photobacterium sp. ZSDE20]MCQ1060940.1 GntR family transcriptional regulator [Photobacterium sp. ZSDE20]MDD1828839.1 GntR family transcriptional regulator [Photobacterium sp. ZSDE20]